MALFSISFGLSYSFTIANQDSLKPAAPEQQEVQSIRFSAKDELGGKLNINEQDKSKIIPILNKLPKDHISVLKELVLDYNPNARRGLGRGDLIILRAANISDKEFFAVLIHELGHSVDMGTLQSKGGAISNFKDFDKPVYENDPSLDFYKISWLSDQKRKRASTNEDFVSGYAMTDPFEDFSETYAYYVLHNRNFWSNAQHNEALNAKYEYMKNLFNGAEFDTGEFEVSIKVPWDITKLDYNLDIFLAS